MLNMRSCPKCKTTDYNNKYFVLMINECGHSLCKNCVETLFVRQSAPCPTCGRTLKKSSFWEQIFDDPVVEKQVYYRKKLGKVFNLKEDDFATLREYNDYLEQVETYVMNLTYDQDVESTKRQIEAFQKEYEELIVKNKNRLSKDEEWILKNLDDERREKERLGQKVYEDPTANVKETNSKAKFDDEAKAIIAELMNSDVDASQIIGRKRYEQKKAKEEDKLKQAVAATKNNADKFERVSFRTKKDEEIVPMSSAGHVGEKYEYAPQPMEINGPPLPDIEMLSELGYLQHIRSASGWQNAGGYHESLGCFRALTEAHCDLFA